jgi:hypothetical protein
MSRRIPRLIGLTLMALLSNTAFGLAAICGNDTSSENAAATEQIIWNYYDYWYSGIYVANDSSIEERIPTDSTYINADSVARMAEGDTLLAGYPAPWGMDSFLRIACPPAEGETETDTSDDSTDDSSANSDRAPIALLCNADLAAGCEPLAAGIGESSTRAATDPTADRKGVAATRITGMIQTLADGVLTVRTHTGRYFTMTLPGNAKIERHTIANLDVLRAGDLVGAMLGGNARGNREATEIRVYRNLGGATAGVSRFATDAEIPPGIELRGVLRNVGSSADNRALRIAYTTREGTVQVPDDIRVRIIEPAGVSDLRLFSLQVEVLALKQDDGSWLVNSIDIL